MKRDYSAWPHPTGFPSGRRRQCFRRSTRTGVRVSRSHIATGSSDGSKNASFEIPKASRARAPATRVCLAVPGEGRSPNGPADEEDWKDTRMPMRYAERGLATRGGMAQAAKEQGKL